MKKRSKDINFICAVIVFCLTFFIIGSESQANTAEQAMGHIVDALHKKLKGQELQRQIALRVEDWPNDLVQFVRVEKGNIPILGEPSLTDSPLNVIGLTKSGEILQFVGKTQIVELHNPLGSEDDSTGIWYKVKVLDGKEGWIFANPDGQSLPFATYFEMKKINQPQEKGNGAGAVITLIIAIAVIAVFLFFRSLSKKETSPSYSTDSSSSYGDSEWGTDSTTENREKAEWPWRDSEVVVGQKNIYEKGFFGDTKVGHSEKNIWGEKELHKETFSSIFSEKIGTVGKDAWGTPKEIIDKKGRKVGDIKTTSFGRKIIIDKNGKEIGEYKDD